MNAEDTEPNLKTRTAALLDRYARAESAFDKFLVLAGGLRWTLALFVGWTVLVAWLAVAVFG